MRNWIRKKCSTMLTKSVLTETTTAEALAKVPSMSKERFQKIADLLYKSANQISGMAFKNLQLQHTINAKEKAEQELRKNEQKYRLFFDINQAGVYRSTINGKVLECNERFAEIFGYRSAKEVIQLPAEVFYKSSESRAGFVDYLKKHQPLTNFEFEVINKQGQSVWLMENVMINENSEYGEPVIQGACTDITHLKKIEKALQESEARYRLLVENAFDGIYLMRGRKYEYVNNRFTEITGYSYEEVTSDSFDFGVLLTDHSRKVVEERYAARQHGENIPSQYDIEIKAKDGSLKFVTVSTMSVSDKGEVVVTGILHDITRRKIAENALWESEERLKLAVDSARIGLWDHNFETDKIIRNDQWSEMLGYRDGEIKHTKDSFLSMIHPDDLKKVN